MDSVSSARSSSQIQNSNSFTPPYCEDHHGYRIDDKFDCIKKNDVNHCTTTGMPKGYSKIDYDRIYRCKGDPNCLPRQREAFFINGIWNKLCDGMKSTWELAIGNDSKATLIHNQTDLESKTTTLGKLYGGAKDLLNAWGGLVSSERGSKLEPAVRAQADLIIDRARTKSDPNWTIFVEAHSQGTILQDNALEIVRQELGLKDPKAWEEFINKHIVIRRYGEAKHSTENLPTDSTTRINSEHDPVFLATQPIEGAIGMTQSAKEFAAEYRQQLEKPSEKNWLRKRIHAASNAWNSVSDKVSQAWQLLTLQKRSPANLDGPNHGFKGYADNRAEGLARVMIHKTAEIKDPKMRGESIARSLISFVEKDTLSLPETANLSEATIMRMPQNLREHYHRYIMNHVKENASIEQREVWTKIAEKLKPYGNR